MITINNLSYKYENSPHSILKNISVTFSSGVINVVIGKNGAGKTTLFDILTRLIRTEGNIVGLPSDKEIIYQLQGLLFPTTLTGKDLFRFFLYTDISNNLKIKNEPYIDEHMSKNEINFMHHIWNTKYGNMSVGERRYLSILAITLIKRKFYIFDEPTSGVDPEARVRVLNRITKLANDPEKIVLLSTHTLHELKNYPCKLHLLHHGVFEFQGSYQEFLEYYDSDDPDMAFYHMIHSDSH